MVFPTGRVPLVRPSGEKVLSFLGRMRWLSFIIYEAIGDLFWELGEETGSKASAEHFSTLLEGRSQQ